MTVLLASAIDATVVIAIALLLIAAMKGRSAALRHSVLAAGIAAAAMSPVLELVVPQVPLLDWNATTTVVSSGVTLTSNLVAQGPEGWTVSPSQDPFVSWPSLLLIVWAAGATCLLAGLVTGLVRLARLIARCVPVSDGPWRSIANELTRAAGLRRRVEILQSTEPSLLITCGVLRPKIILPAGASSWSEGRQRIVLAHELEHVRRGDGAMQLAAELLRAVHWFNPLMALACRRLRQCDDAVLNDGVEATEYAAHLLGVARHVGRARVWASAPAIAHPSTLERRISSMLNHERDRQPLTRRTSAWAATAAVAVVIPLTAASIAPVAPPNGASVGNAGDVALAAQPARPDTDPAPPVTVQPARPVAVPPARPVTAQPAPPVTVQPARPVGAPARTPVQQPRVVTPTAATAPAAIAAVLQASSTISGTVRDQSGAVLPGVRMNLNSQEYETRSTVTDVSGQFAFRDLLPARYDLLASLPGFAIVSSAVPLAEGTSAQRVITLPVGTLEETIMVVCSAATPLARAVTPSIGRGASETSTLKVLSRVMKQGWNSALDALFPVVSAQQFPGPPPTPPPPVRLPVRVGGNLQAPKKLTDVKPVCPSTVSAGVATNVVLLGRIGVDGIVNEVTLVPGVTGTDPMPEFVQSAVDAVRQWVFTPTLLNGTPVPVNVTVRISYNAR
jgi:beta-lactamase regulating signal transducer with metallopeptidase domain